MITNMNLHPHDSNIDDSTVARGLDLLFVQGNAEESYSHFSYAIETTYSDEDKNRMIQFRDAAGAVLVRMDLESGDNFARLGQYGSALTTYLSMKNVGDSPIMLQFQLEHNSGACLARLGRKEEALVSHFKALQLNPGNSKTLKNIAILLADMGKFVEAISAFDEYLRIHPKSYSAMCGKAGCLKDLRLYAKSIDIADEAQLLDPKFLRGKCACDLKEYCRQEILKLKYSRTEDAPAEYKASSLAEFLPPTSVVTSNANHEFRSWLESAKLHGGSRNIFEDFNLPKYTRSDALFSGTVDSPQKVMTPHGSLNNEVHPFCVRIPGSDISVNSTPHKQNKHRNSDVLIDRHKDQLSIDSSACHKSAEASCDRKQNAAGYSVQPQQSRPGHRFQKLSSQELKPKDPLSILSRNESTSGVIASSVERRVTDKKVAGVFDKYIDSSIKSPTYKGQETLTSYVTSPLSESMITHKADYREFRGRGDGISAQRKVSSLSSASEVMGFGRNTSHLNIAPVADSYRDSSYQPPMTTVANREFVPTVKKMQDVNEQRFRTQSSFRSTTDGIAGGHAEAAGRTSREGVLRRSSQINPSNISDHNSDAISPTTMFHSFEAPQYRRHVRVDNSNELIYYQGIEISKGKNECDSISLSPTVTSSFPSSSGRPNRRQMADSNQGTDQLNTRSALARGSKSIDHTQASTLSTPHQRNRRKDAVPSANLDLPTSNTATEEIIPVALFPYETLRHLGGPLDSSNSSINSSHKEDNLYDEEFQRIFEMTRDQWNALPSWQKARKKKQLRAKTKEEEAIIQERTCKKSGSTITFLNKSNPADFKEFLADTSALHHKAISTTP